MAWLISIGVIIATIIISILVIAFIIAVEEESKKDNI